MKVLVNGVECDLFKSGVDIRDIGDRVLVRTDGGMRSALAVKRGDTTFVSFDGGVFEVKKVSGSRSGAGAIGNGESRAPMPGQIVEVAVVIDQLVEIGERLIVLEAMKMQQPLVASVAGRVSQVNVSVGDQVSDGDVLVVISPEGE